MKRDQFNSGAAPVCIGYNRGTADYTGGTTGCIGDIAAGPTSACERVILLVVVVGVVIEVIVVLHQPFRLH